MEKLYDLHETYLRKTKLNFRRYLIDDINWEGKLIAIKGPKGVGKTTMILQYIKENYKGKEALYVSMDSIVAKPYSIFEIAEYHVNKGGTSLFIDEIHKYTDWSREIKTIHDLYPDLQVVFSGSSILQIYKSFADLSRRAVAYNMEGLSFREFLTLETGIVFDKLDLKNILKNHVSVAEGIIEKVNVFKYFEAYLQHGYYPFYLESIKDFNQKLEQVINNSLDVDLPFILEISVHNIFKIKKLLYLLATELPFQPNVSKLAGSLELNRNTLNNYLYYLSECKMISLLTDAGKSYSTLSKPEKIFMHNTNLVYAINGNKVNVGTIRELFFYNQVSAKNAVNFVKKGDFIVDNQYVFEVGGAQKSFTQIADIKDSYLAIDDVQIGRGNKVPLWLFGFLY
jgi:predicted AAA+ superfamily ATPase